MNFVQHDTEDNSDDQDKLISTPPGQSPPSHDGTPIKSKSDCGVAETDSDIRDQPTNTSIPVSITPEEAISIIGRLDKTAEVLFAVEKGMED